MSSSIPNIPRRKRQYRLDIVILYNIGAIDIINAVPIVLNPECERRKPC
jgi:hypothetical protein